MQNEEFKNKLLERSYKYALSVIRFVDSLDKRDWSTQVIAKQLLRSATSVGANIVEAQAASSTRDFANFLTHALKSANESTYWLKLLVDAGKTASVHASEIAIETDELARILGASVSTMKSRTEL